MITLEERLALEVFQQGFNITLISSQEIHNMSSVIDRYASYSTLMPNHGGQVYQPGEFQYRNSDNDITRNIIHIHGFNWLPHCFVEYNQAYRQFQNLLKPGNTIHIYGTPLKITSIGAITIECLTVTIQYSDLRHCREILDIIYGQQTMFVETKTLVKSTTLSGIKFELHRISEKSSKKPSKDALVVSKFAEMMSIPSGILEMTLTHEKSKIRVSERINTTTHDVNKMSEKLFSKLKKLVQQQRHSAKNYYDKFYEGRILEMMNTNLRDILGTKKRPDELDGRKFIGVEVEFYSKQNEDTILPFFKSMKRRVQVKYDTSIHPEEPGTYGHEVTLLTTKETYEKDVSELCAILKTIDAKVNSSCGLHVHLDARHLNYDSAKNVYANLVKCLPWFTQMVSKSRLNNRYCIINKSAKNEPKQRYYAINFKAYEQHKTIEVRLHHGTIDAESIIRWISILTTISQASFDRRPRRLAHFKRLGVSDKDIAYMQERINVVMSEPDAPPRPRDNELRYNPPPVNRTYRRQSLEEMSRVYNVASMEPSQIIYTPITDIVSDNDDNDIPF